MIGGSTELAKLSGSMNAITRLSELAKLSGSMNVMGRSTELAKLNGTMNVMGRSTELAKLSGPIDVIGRSTELAKLSGSMNAITRLSELTKLNGTMNAITRSTELAKLSRSMNVITRSSELTSFSQALTGIARSIELPRIIGRRITETLAPFRVKTQFEQSEWFPHSTFPRQLLERISNDEYSDEIVLTYYRRNWSTVSRVIEQELSECQVDRDAKEAVRQALIAHEQGLFQLVPSSMFAAIERAVRVCLHGDKVGRVSVKNRLVDLVGRLPLSVLPDGLLAFIGFTQLSHHLYENIHTDDIRERFLDASIPNRHAAIHGLVIYSSEKSSLNSIFVAMYVFQILTVLKFRYLRSS